MEKLVSEFSVGLFFWQTLLFLSILFLLRKFAWKPILKAVTEREESIENALLSAEKAKEEMAALNEDNKKLLAQAHEERDNLLKKAKEIHDGIIADAKGRAQAEADKVMEKAKQAINMEKQAAIVELKNQVAALSIEIAEKIVSEKLSSDDKQRALANSLVEEVSLN
jgi:F-type H+-transporting ATPase subunit b